MTNLCPECGFDFDSPLIDQVRAVALLPDDAMAIVDRAGAQPYGRPSPEVWSPNGYVWHLADVMRMFAEWLHKIRVQHHPVHVAPDGEGLAMARRYDDLPLATGLWSLRASCELFAQEAAMADPDRMFLYKDWKDCTAAEVIGFAAHEAAHHLLDLERGLVGAGSSAATG